MTVSSTTNRKSYAGDGVTTSFATSPVVFVDTSDLTVYVVTDSTGAVATLVENTDYTVTGGSGSTGTVDTSAGYGAPAVGETLLIVRNVPLTQATDLVNNDASDAEVVESAFDKVTMLAQQLSTKIDRSFVLSDSDTSGASLTVPSPSADKLIGWNAAADGLENKAPADLSLSTVTAFIDTLLDDADAATARATLGSTTVGDALFIAANVVSALATLGITNQLAQPGDVKDVAHTTVPTGWLECDWSEHDPAVLPALYAAIGTVWNRGDETAGYFRVPPPSVRIGRGTAKTFEMVTASSSNGFTVASNNTKWITGMPVVLSNLTGFTTSATAGPTYYAVRISATNVRLATTLAKAQTNAPDVTLSGTGTATLTTTFTARTVGELGGEEGHAMSITELLAHTHTQDSFVNSTTTGAGSSPITSGTKATGSTGGHAAANIMQPFGVYMTIIKT